MNGFNFIVPSKNIIILYKPNTIITNTLKFYINRKLKKELFSNHISNQNLNLLKKILSNIYTYIEFWYYKKKINKQHLCNLYKSFDNKYDLVIIKENYKSIYFDYKNQLIKKNFEKDFIDTNLKLISELSNYIDTSFIKIEKNFILEKLIDGEILSPSKINLKYLEKIYLSSLNRKYYSFAYEKDLLKISETISKLSFKKKIGVNFTDLNQSFKSQIKKFKFVVSYNDCSIHNLIVKEDKLYYIDLNPRKISLAPSFYEYYCLIISSKVEYDIDFDSFFFKEFTKKFLNKIDIEFNNKSLNFILYSTIVFMIYYKKININSADLWLSKIFIDLSI